MGRKLSLMGWADAQKEMSIAGDPEKVVEIGQDIHALIAGRMDQNNLAEIENMLFALRIVEANLKHWERTVRKRQHPK